MTKNMQKSVEEDILESGELNINTWQKEVLLQNLQLARIENPWLSDQGDDVALIVINRFHCEASNFADMPKRKYARCVRNFISNCLQLRQFQLTRLTAKGYDEKRGFEHKSIDDLIAEGDEYVITYLYKSKDIGDQVDFAAFCDWCKRVKRFRYVKAYVLYGNVREAAKALTKRYGHNVSKSTVHNVLTWLVKNFPW